MSERKDFHIGDILSVTTGRLVSLRHMDGIYDILNFMTQDNLFTHQLPRASDDCKPWLLRWHPELAEVDASGDINKDNFKEWLAEQAVRLGETLWVETIPTDDQNHRDPVEELEERLRPDQQIIEVQL